MKICLILGRAYLWQLFDPSGDDCIPNHRRTQIMQAYADLGQRNRMQTGDNPVKRKPLVVAGNDSEVIIDVVGGEEGGTMDARNAAALGRQEVRLLAAQVFQLRTMLIDTRAEAMRQIEILKKQNARLSNNVTRFINRPAFSMRRPSSAGRVHGVTTESGSTTIAEASQDVPTAADDVSGGNLDFVQAVAREQGSVVLQANLSRCPRSLYELWNEYMFGFYGNKPAKDFTAQERGKVKFAYYRWNVFWVQVAKMVREGYTHDRAIDLIYECYGRNCAVTKILMAMIRDRKTGGHPALRDRQL